MTEHWTPSADTTGAPHCAVDAWPPCQVCGGGVSLHCRKDGSGTMFHPCRDFDVAMPFASLRAARKRWLEFCGEVAA